MTFAITPVAAKDGAGTTISGGVNFIDVSGAGTGPWEITKVAIDPAGVNTQAILTNSAAKTDLSSVAGATVATGHGTASGAVRVELPSDSTGVIGATQSGTWTVQPGNTANTTAWKVDGSAVTQPISGTVTANAGTGTLAVSIATVPSHAVTNAGTFAVQDTQLAAGATAVAKAEDAASASADVGIPAMAIQKATPADTAGTDGDYSMLQMSAGRLWVDPSGVTLTVGSHAVTNAGTFATQAAQSGTWTVQPGNTANTTAWKVDASSVAVPVTDNSGSLTVDNGGTFAVQAAITAASTSIADAAIVTLGAKADAKSTATDTTAITAMQVLKQISASVQAPPSQAVTNAGTFAVQAACAGDTASAASDAGNPVKVGAVGKTANPTAVTDGQRVNLISDKLGKLITVGAIRDLKGVTQTQISNTTSETTIVAAVASTFLDVYGLVFANTGATTTKVTIKDATAGTTRMIFEVPTLETRGFMVPVDSAIPQAVVNNNWTATCASATTAMEVTAYWVKNT